MQDLRLQLQPKPIVGLRLSPQMRISLEILQKPALELKAAVEQALSENPFLECEEPRSDEISLEQLAETADEKEEDWPQGEIDETGMGDQQAKRDYQISLVTGPVSLPDELMKQSRLLISSDEVPIGEEILGNLNEDGYLLTPVEEIAKTLGVTEEAVRHVLEIVQRLEPNGVGARDLRECLLIQLRARRREGSLAWRIVEQCLDLLIRRKLRKIAQHLRVPLNDIRQAVQEIATLDPKPGRRLAAEVSHSIVPDVIVQAQGDRLEIDGSDGYLPRVQIRKEFQKFLSDRKNRPSLNPELKLKYQEAIGLVKALQAREKTLEKITRALVQVQPDFFKEGPRYLKPLAAKELAKKVRLHESTVSRAIQDKYIATPFGLFRMKDLFTRRAITTKEETLFNDQLKETIRKMILKEDAATPLSDQEIAQRLQSEGISIARRTVAKYREALRILPSRLRRS